MGNSENLRGVAEELVKNRILGPRKGSDAPQYLHSVRVADVLEQFGYGEDVILAGLLHDIIEDSETTYDELRDVGISERVIEMVELCTHKEEIENGDSRWTEMMSRLIMARDEDAWAVKVSDISDNLRDSDTLPDARRRFMREAKVPLLLAISQDVVGDTKIWKALKELSDAYMVKE